MPLISPILEQIVVNQVPDGVYMRNTDDDANVDIDQIDLENKTIVIYNNLPEVEQVLPEFGTTIWRNWAVGVRVLRLAELDDNGTDGDVIRATCLDAIDIIYDNLIRSVDLYTGVALEGYTTTFEGNVKIYDKIMTGLSSAFTLPILRSTYYCDPLPTP